jgi:hypothetical protein
MPAAGSRVMMFVAFSHYHIILGCGGRKLVIKEAASLRLLLKTVLRFLD